MNEKVSIIVPTYKRKPELVIRTIDSLLNQSYKNIEIVIVDDNARPDLTKYREGISKMIVEINDNKIIYLQNNSNLGGALARNAGIAVATGKYITFLDDDDKYEFNKVERQLNFVVEKDLDVCFSELAIYNEKDKLIDYRSHEDIEKFDNDYLFRYHLTRQITGTPTFMIKKECLDVVGGFDDVKMGQEFYLMAKLLKTNYKVGYFPESNIRAYRYDTEAISTGLNKISGEKKLFQYKKNHFNILEFSDRQYTRCRHYAVMAVAYKRNHKIAKALWNLLVSVMCNPVLAIKEAYNFNKRKKHTGNMSI